MDWNDLRFVLALSRHGSLSAASRALSVEHTTVGRRLTSLEETLRARLFDRTPEGYVATASGEVVLAHARAIEDRTLSLEREVSGRDARVGGTVRITGLDAFVNELLLPNLASLRARYPDLDIVAAAEIQVVDLSRREGDIGIRFARPRDPNLVARKLADIGSALFASRDYVARRGYLHDPHDLTGHDVVRYAPEFASASEEEWIEEHAKGARVAVRVSSPTSHLRALRLGLGVGIHECHAGDSYPELVRMSPKPVLMEAWWAVVHVDMARTARVRAVLDFLSEMAAANRERLSGVRVRPAAAPRAARQNKRGR